jgi:FMN phosphatase YigB (HAD superfamily)
MSSSSQETVSLIAQRYGAHHLIDEMLAQYTSPLPPHFSIPATPHAKTVLEILRSQGNILALVTGGVASYQMEKLEKAGLEPSIFSKITIPGDSQKRPCFAALAQEFSQPSSESVAVGDRVQMDLAPAHDLGWRTVHMRWGRGRMGHKENWVDHSIHELSELLEFL